jgi:phosphorylated adapter RNA export protein
MDVSENESSSSNGSSRSAKRAKNNFNKRKKRLPKILADLTVPLHGSDDEFGRDLSQKLEEENVDLILKTVSVIGRKLCTNLFQITQRIERDGGMMTMNKLRRRTPGGIFLFLLKTSDKIDEDSKNEVFHSGKANKSEKSIADRKLSSEQTESKDPPNSPANPEFIETNGKITDPDLVSQKILNFSKPELEPSRANEDILELDYNDEMDTF